MEDLAVIVRDDIISRRDRYIAHADAMKLELTSSSLHASHMSLHST